MRAPPHIKEGRVMSTSHTTDHTATHRRGGELTVTDDGRVLNDPTHSEPIGHGNSVASWALVLLVIVGAIVVMFGMLSETLVVTLVGVGLAVVGLIVGFVLKKAGKGVDDSQIARH